MGWLGESVHANPQAKLLLITGFCGGFTTFSAFAAENLTLFLQQQYGTLFLYNGLSLVAGIFAVWLGLHLAK